jgi:hypothetical protein
MKQPEGAVDPARGPLEEEVGERSTEVCQQAAIDHRVHGSRAPSPRTGAARSPGAMAALRAA